MSSVAENTDCLKVLIVEDELLLAMEIESELEQFGHSVVGIAADAAQAIAIAGVQAPDLALVDVNLRDGASGPQIASELTMSHKVFVVFVTGNPEQIPLDYAGAFGSITKPWTRKTIEQLLAFVSRYRAGEPDISPPVGMRLAPFLVG